MSDIRVCLTYSSQAEEAVKYYLSVFESGKILDTMHLGSGSPDSKGAVLSVTFELLGQTFIALNAGPGISFSPGISMFVTCDTQAEIDRYWGKLTDGGKEVQCGWLVDKFGVSWQIVPRVLGTFLADKDPVKSGRAMQAMLKMQKLDIAALKRAFDGV